MALNRKIAYIDLTNETISIEPIPLEWRRKYIGGRGLDAYLLFKHVPQGCDPLGSDNVVIISAGLLGGTLASSGSRTHIAAKSPLTNLFGSASIGGFFGPEMRWAGIDHFIIRGKANRPVYINTHDGEIEIRDADHLWGAGVHDTQAAICKELGDEETQILCIGPAGENLVRYASVITGRKDAGARSGMGAVLGSKNLKAIACRGTMEIEISDPEQALEYNKQTIDQVISSKASQSMQRWGTNFMFGITNTTGLIRTHNFKYNQLPKSEGLEAENLDEYSIGMDACFGCQIHCRHRYLIKDGEHAGAYDVGPDYISQGAFGAEVGCCSMETVLVGNHLVNDYGIDTLEIGSLIAWAMELYEKGIITDKETDGLKLEWGNDEAVLTLIEQVALRKGFGDILAEGPLRAAGRLGPETLKYLVQVKGMSNLHTDERAAPALALSVAVSSRGSDHARGIPAIDLYNLPMEVMDRVYRNPDGYDGPLTNDFAAYEGKPRMVMWQELCYMMVESLGVCKYHTVFLSPNHPAFTEFSRMIQFNTGLEFSEMDLWECAHRSYTIERLFNLREGMTCDDDWLSDRYFDEPTPLGLPGVRGKSIDRQKFKDMLDEYYRLHEWDDAGVPTPQLLKKLNIGDLWPAT